LLTTSKAQETQEDAISVTPEVAGTGKSKPKRSAKPKSEQPETLADRGLESTPAPEAAPIVSGATAAHPKAPQRTWDWDRTQEEAKQKEAARLETERLSRLPLPPPKAKTLPWPDFCEYWNALRELPISPCIRLYVQRWLPVLLPVIETDRFGASKESHPSDLKIQTGDGPLSEDLILQLGGVGDYTFRLNDTRRPWEQGTICQSQLETKRLWDTYPPVFDLKRLDYEDKKNQVFIKFARARGILPREDEMEKEQADMAQVTAIDTVLEDSRKERERTDKLQREALDRAERELREQKEATARAQAEAQAAKADEPKPAAPASDLLNVVTSVATLAKSLQAPKDDSLSEYLKLQQEREKTEREREREERETSRQAAAGERKRADDLQAQILADLKEANKAPAAVVTSPAPPLTLAQQFQDMETLMGAAKRIAKGGATAEEESKPSNIDKWLDAMPFIQPVAQSLIGGIFQTIHFGFQTWQTISYNNALAKNGGEPKAPTTMDKPPEPGKPIQPQGPPPTPEQQAQAQQMPLILQGLAKLIGPLRRALNNSKTGDEFAESMIDFTEDGRADYDKVRNVAETLTRIGMQVPGEPGVEQFKQAAGFLFQQFPAFYQKVATLPTFGTFLEEFYEYDKIAAEKQQEQK
jgi:hypothetical protein